MAKEIEGINIDAIQAFLDWQIEMRMAEGDYSLVRYEYHLTSLRNQKIINKALEMLDKYNKGTDWSQEMLDSLAAILRSNK